MCQTLDDGQFVGWFNCHNFNIRAVIFRTAAGSRQRTAGTDPGHKMSNLTGGLLPNLNARGAVVRLPISEIVVLIGQEIPVQLSLICAPYFQNGSVDAFQEVGQN